jgi:signal transduction histidine kinase
MAFVVNAYRFLKENKAKETLVLLAFDNIGDLLRTNDDLKSVNEQLEQFIFVSGHDLQEPLRKIQIFSNYLLGYDNTDDYIRQCLEKINQTASRMSALLRPAELLGAASEPDEKSGQHRVRSNAKKCCRAPGAGRERKGRRNHHRPAADDRSRCESNGAASAT